MNFDQGEFSFDANDDETGYHRWRERLDEQRKAFEKRWGVPLGHRVRLQLRGYQQPLSGRIEVIDPRSTHPRFRLGRLEFHPEDIESLVRED